MGEAAMDNSSFYNSVHSGLENGEVSSAVDEMVPDIDHAKLRYPFCIVWTPIPLLTWLIPVIGHMGICTSKGIIRDFAGPYVVSEDRMAFGNPTKYWQLTPARAKGGTSGWDSAVYSASEEYKTRMHNLCCDNCHSHVAYALTLMKYNDIQWNMIMVWFYFTLHCKYISVLDWFKTWLPFLLLVIVIVCVCTWL
ncbi:transmembrane protein 222 [Ischnura elegans]|uniref:transmembrane protein 222 n=1 Tax=Ischnura elegans TaxID=197161 RepID=UPI001ED8B89C|nr:transmembrane protein 222 [Ischnura elegans]